MNISIRKRQGLTSSQFFVLCISLFSSSNVSYKGLPNTKVLPKLSLYLVPWKILYPEAVQPRVDISPQTVPSMLNNIFMQKSTKFN